MSDLKSRLANLTPEQRAEFLRRLKESQAAPAAPLPRADRSQALALSFAQRRLWFLERLDGSSAAYNMPAAFRLRGALDVAALQAALSGVTARHEVLRTRLVEQDGEPRQVIDAPQPLALALVDLSVPHPGPLPASEGDEGSLRESPSGRDEALHRLLREEAARAFDLAREQPLRALLVKLGPEEHVVAINVHHVASDGWSTGIMVRELAALYNAHRAGQAAPLPELPVQYADYAAWQQSELAQPGKFAASLDFWRKQLADAPVGTNLPTDFARAAQPSSAGDNVWFDIDAASAAQVRALAQQFDASVYQVLLTVFLILLQRWSGDTDITVGSPIANRPRPELEGLIGFFVNTLPIRVSLADDPDFLTLLARVRAVTLESYAHAEIPFEQLVEKINPERRLNQSPFFQVMFAMQNAAAAPGSGLDGLQIDTIPVASGASRLDLTLSMQDSESGLSGCLEYASALFRPETAQRFTEHFRNLLHAALHNNLPISRLDLLSKAERHRLLVEWNRTETQRDRRACLHHLVEQQAAKTPDAPALRWNSEVWSYGRLLDESTRIARLLQQRGIAPDTLVGVCLDRSPRMVAALLGVLRSGGAYVALDPAYPAARLAYIVADSAAPVILTNRRYRAEIFAAMSASEALALDELELPADDSPLPDGGATPAHLAYVLYTSGSTGKPKGVAIEHHSPAAFLDWARSVWPLDELAGVLAGTSICFDLSIFEIFLPLSVGGTVILAENVLELPNIPARDRVTLINTVPSAIDALLRQNALPAGVRVVNLAGEPLTTELADRVYGVPNVAKVYDLYGPSEDTTYSTCKLRQPGEAPSIGRPLANTCLYILDRALQPVPVGVPGEIYLGGEGLARGYLGKADLTAERFVPSPFPAVARLYRTGDLARFRPDGNVEYLGRIDHQVKLRGFRIELGEIESVLREFPGGGASVVIVATTSAGNQRLIGYLAHPQGDAILPELRAHLVARLPDYMVPAALVALPALPLTPNGKIDRQALPAPEARASAGQPAPASAEEARLAAIWEELLGREPGSLRRDDDFFALGGHSLLAVRLQSRIRDRFSREVALRELFEHPLLHQQAALLGGSGKDTDEGAIPLCDRSQPLALSFAQERLWFLDQIEPGNPAYNMPGALRLTGEVDVAALQAAFDAVVARHEILCLAFPAQGGVAGAVPLAEPPRLAAVDLRGQPAAVAAYLDEDARRPFDLARGPLVRAAALRVAEREVVLAATLHHIVADGWSIGLFLDELCRHYAAPGTVPPLRIQYPDFAAWQRARYASGALDSQLAYWRDTLGDAPALLELPLDRPRPATQRHGGALHNAVIDAACTAQLAQFNRQQGTTPFMVMLTAYAVLLSRYAGQDDVVIGFPSAGRNAGELEPLLGMFVNTLPIRVKLDGLPSFSELVAQVKTRTLEALANQDLPFEKLVDELQVERNLAYSPLFQVMLAMQNAPPGTAAPDGIAVEPYAAAQTSTAKFDLTLSLAEQGDGYAAAFEYDTDLFDAATVARMAGHFAELLRAALAAPDTPVARLPLLGAQERRLLLEEWNTTATGYPRGACIQHLFEEQVERTPEAIAVATGDAQLSYRELNRRANRLAHHLRGLGVTAAAPVAMCVERSPEMVVALLGILKAGGAYVPLDPDDPAERLHYVLDDTAAMIVVTHRATAERIPATAGLQRVCLDADGPAIAAANPDNPPSQGDAGQLAYIMYTSGSTGRPKGVCIPHRAIVRLVRNTNYVEVGAQDVLLQMAPISFDASTFELWASLLNGARLAIFPAGPLTFDKLCDTLRRHRVTILWLTAGLFHRVVEEHLACLGSVKQLLAGGDVLSPWHVRKVLRELPGCCLINGYGPTENTTFTCCHRMTSADQAGTSVSIGRPISNTRVYVLDAQRQPVPIGVPGELYAGGDGCALGYLNDARLNEEKFLPDPFGKTPEGRLYRSGDRVRYLADGTLEFLGRNDRQVKIRGFRIEPGEIEARLCEHPALRAAAVVVQHNGPQHKLAAFVVPESGATADDALLADIARHVAETLPAFMQPALYLPIDALPLTANAKLDRQALLALIPTMPVAGGEDDAPCGAAEESLAEVWCELLNLESVGVRDNYFALGGDSILTIVMIAKLRERGWQLQLKEVFRHQTIRALAAVLTRRDAGEAAPVEETGRLALTPLQQMFFDLAPPSPHHFNQAVLLRLAADIAVEHLEAALGEILRVHPALRSRFVQDDDGWHQEILATTPVALTVHDLADRIAPQRDAERERCCDAAQRSLDIGSGPLFRAVLFRWADAAARLLLVAHHLVVDAVSWRVIVADLESALHQTRAGTAPTLPAEPCGPAAYRRALATYDHRAEAVYWRNILACGGDALQSLDGGSAGTPRPAQVISRLPAAETRNLLTEVHRAYHTRVPDLLLCALARELCRLAGRGTVLVDVEGHGRDALGDAIDLSRAVGWFTTLHPVRLPCPPGEPLLAALPLVKEALRSAPHSGIGFALSHRDGDAAAGADVCFNYLGQSGAATGGTAVLGIAPEPSGDPSAADLPRRYRLECNASVVGDELLLHYGFDAGCIAPAAIEALAAATLAGLRQLIADCLAQQDSAYTPSDFGEVCLEQSELDEVLNGLDLSGMLES